MTRPLALVTGGAGFIGSHVASRFARGGYDVRVLDNLSSGDERNCEPEWKLLRADVRDPDAVDAAAAGVDVAVHLAAFTSVPDSFAHFEDCYRTNVLGTHNVLESCARHGITKLVFASSSAVYAELPDSPKSEADCPEPISPYGVSKLEGEHLLEIYRERRGLASTALRFFNVYGPRQPADSAYAAAIPIFMERGLREQAMTIYGEGSQTRDFVFVGDVAEAVFRSATANTSNACGVFNVGTGRAIRIAELADTIAKLSGSGVAHRFEDRRPGDVLSSTADVSRISKALEWSPERTLESGLDETVEWYRKRLAEEAV